MDEHRDELDRRVTEAAETLGERVEVDVVPAGEVVSRAKRRRRSRVVAVGVIGVVVIAMAVGASALVLRDRPTPTATGPGVGTDQSGLAPFCEDLPELGPVRDGGRPGADNPPPDLMQVLTTHQQRHPDTAAGLWIDRANGSTIVLAFTDEPQRHRDEIAGLRVSPDDTPYIQPTPTYPATTTVAESSWVVDVVQARFTESELRALMQQATQLSKPGLTIKTSAVDTQRNRVEIWPSSAPDDTTRRYLADQLGVDRICVPKPPPTLAERAGQPEPTSLIPTEGADPLVTCDGSFAFLASQRTTPTPLQEGDPLLDALRQALTSKDSGFPVQGRAEDFLLIGRDADTATLAQGAPSGPSLTFKKMGDRWVLQGAGGAAGGQSCSQPRVVPPPGLGPVEWALDPSSPAPQPTDTVLHIVVDEIACAGVESTLLQRLQPPEIAIRGDTVLIGLGATALTGFQACAGLPGERTTITLPEPLGSRQLLDGTWWPPKAPTTDGMFLMDGPGGPTPGPATPPATSPDGSVVPVGTAIP